MLKIGVLGNYFRPEREGAPSTFGAYYTNKDYIDSLEGLDVLPLCFPYTLSTRRIRSFLEMLDGLLLTGGFDIPSSFFREEEIQGPSYTYDAQRVEFELLLLDEVEKLQLPVFAICLGLQMYNVHRGGTLIQDIPTQLPASKINHSASSKDSRVLSHPVEVKMGSYLYSVLGKQEIEVNSSHHQAVGKVGKGLLINAVSEDGVIEGLESEDSRFVGVQWHPESLQYEMKEHSSLFEDFVKRCTEFAGKKSVS